MWFEAVLSKQLNVQPLMLWVVRCSVAVDNEGKQQVWHVLYIKAAEKSVFHRCWKLHVVFNLLIHFSTAFIWQTRYVVDSFFFFFSKKSWSYVMKYCMMHNYRLLLPYWFFSFPIAADVRFNTASFNIFLLTIYFYTWLEGIYAFT